MEPPAAAGTFNVQPGLPPATAAPAPAAPTGTTELTTAWPRRVQWATAALLGLAGLLLFVHAVAVQPGGSRPSEIQRSGPLHYRVDLNKARRSELLQLPGIGPALAERIEAYRDEAGGFRSVEELARVRGIGPATLQRLRPLVCVNAGEFDDVEEAAEVGARKPVQHISAYPPAAGPVRPAGKKKEDSLKGPINVNRASQAELQMLPGIGPKLSQRILDTRQQRRFATVEELRRVPGIGPKTLEKLRPHVIVGD